MAPRSPDTVRSTTEVYSSGLHVVVVCPECLIFMVRLTGDQMMIKYGDELLSRVAEYETAGCPQRMRLMVCPALALPEDPDVVK